MGPRIFARASARGRVLVGPQRTRGRAPRGRAAPVVPNQCTCSVKPAAAQFLSVARQPCATVRKRYYVCTVSKYPTRSPRRASTDAPRRVRSLAAPRAAPPVRVCGPSVSVPPRCVACVPPRVCLCAFGSYTDTASGFHHVQRPLVVLCVAAWLYLLAGLRHVPRLLCARCPWTRKLRNKLWVAPPGGTLWSARCSSLRRLE